MSNGIRDNERCGRAEVHRCLEGEEPEKMLEVSWIWVEAELEARTGPQLLLFVQVLGEKPELSEGHTEDLSVDASHRNQAQLFMVAKSWSPGHLPPRSPQTPERSSPRQVSNRAGDMEVTQVAEHSPFSQDALLSSECFILDNGANGHIYVWKGWNLEPNPDPEPSFPSKGTFHVRAGVRLSVCVCVSSRQGC